MKCPGASTLLDDRITADVIGSDGVRAKHQLTKLQVRYVTLEGAKMLQVIQKGIVVSCSS